MTSRERYLKVLRGELADRVPVTLFIQDGGHFLNQVYPEVDSWDFEACERKVIEVQKQLGCDAHLGVFQSGGCQGDLEIARLDLQFHLAPSGKLLEENGRLPVAEKAAPLFRAEFPVAIGGDDPQPIRGLDEAPQALHNDGFRIADSYGLHA